MEIYIRVRSTACPYGRCVLIGLSVKYSASFLSDPFDNVHRRTIIVHSCDSTCDVIIILLHCHGCYSSENSSIDLYKFHVNSLNYLNNIPAIIIMMAIKFHIFKFYITNNNTYFGDSSYNSMVISFWWCTLHLN